MGHWLLEQESISRRWGSGLSAEGLQGTWFLDTVWPRRSTEPSALSGALLRSLGARLEIGAGDKAEAPLRLCNRVRLGALDLSFEGPGRLEGRRPLLVFRFERLRLALGGWVVLDRPLNHPRPFAEEVAGRLPFFALIGGAPEPDLLGARGRGGGLAQWRRGETGNP